MATLRGKAERLKERAGPEFVAWAEGRIARYEEKIKITDWVIPGDTSEGAALDMATTILRRGERWCTRLQEEGYIDSRALCVYVNRLSDLLFLMARAADRGVEVGE